MSSNKQLASPDGTHLRGLRRIQLFAVLAAVALAAGLALTAWFSWNALAAVNQAAQVDYSRLKQVQVVSREVELMNAAFKGMDGGQAPARLDKLAEQAQRVNAQLRALGVLPARAVAAMRLADAFDAWFGHAGQAARLLQEPGGAGTGAAIDAMEDRYAVLQEGLEREQLLAVRRISQAAAAGGAGVRQALDWLAIAVALALGTLGMMTGCALQLGVALRRRPAPSMDGWASAHDVLARFRLGRQAASTARLARPPSHGERMR